jgi:hypothetical protein
MLDGRDTCTGSVTIAGSTVIYMGEGGIGLRRPLKPGLDRTIRHPHSPRDKCCLLDTTFERLDRRDNFRTLRDVALNFTEEVVSMTPITNEWNDNTTAKNTPALRRSSPCSVCHCWDPVRQR